MSIKWDGIYGSVTGTLKKVSDWEEFSGNTDEQNGNYFPLTLSAVFADKPITVQRNSDEPKTVVDRNWILRIPDKNVVFTFSVNNDTIFVLDFAKASLSA